MKKAIVNSGDRRLIGECEDSVKPGDVCVVKNAYELRCNSYLIPTPNGLAMVHKNTVVSLDSEEEAVDIDVKIDNIRWFDQMKDRGRKYDLMIAEFEEAFVKDRAAKAGITTAKTMPTGKSSIIL